MSIRTASTSRARRRRRSWPSRSPSISASKRAISRRPPGRRPSPGSRSEDPATLNRLRLDDRDRALGRDDPPRVEAGRSKQRIVLLMRTLAAARRDDEHLEIEELSEEGLI